MDKIIKKVFFICNMISAIVVATLWMQNIKKQVVGQQPLSLNQYIFIVPHVRQVIHSIINLEEIQMIGALLGIYLLSNYYVKSILQFIGEYSPIQPVYTIKCLRNIIDSMILYTTILSSLIAYMLITNYQLNKLAQAQDNAVSLGQFSSVLIHRIIETFFIGRIIFSIGYLVGTIFGHQTFRAIGVGLTFVPIVISISAIFDFNVWAYF